MMGIQHASLAGNKVSDDGTGNESGVECTPDDLIQRFNRDGYVVVEQAISADRCTELLQFIISSFSETEPDYIIASDFRMHTPLILNTLTKSSISQVVQPVYGLLDAFLEGEKHLVELSSITVFPNASAQNLHPDESNPGKFIVSVFVNLTPTQTESGALLIVPGSHRDQSKEYSVTEAIPVELPAGSAVFMNSKTWHCGGANQSLDRIRPVFYFSFGDQGLEGPTYSIRQDVLARGMVLQDFRHGCPQNTALTLSSVPEFSPDVELLCSIFQEDRVFVIRDGENVGSFSVENGWILDILRMIQDESHAHSIGAIAAKSGCIPGELLQVCQTLSEAGIIFFGETTTPSPVPQAIASDHGYSIKPTPVPVNQ